MCNKKNFQPLLIIGAARSGTKILRNTIGDHPKINSIPYDINFVWKYGNEKIVHDELSMYDFNEKSCVFINGFFSRYAVNYPIVIEKTVSNTLRVSYTNLIFPNAKYIHLIRHPLDVIESVYRQWTKSPDLMYLLKKSFSFPFIKCYDYAFKYVINEGKRVFSRSKSLQTTWGPIYNGLFNDIEKLSLWEVCALQWQKCYLSSAKDLEAISENSKLIVKYEDFVSNPSEILLSINNFLGIENNSNYQISKITPENVGNGKKIPTEIKEKILSIIEPQMIDLGYDIL